MFERKIVVQTLVAAVVLLTIGTNVLKAQASDVDIERFEIIFQKGFVDGVQESLPWGLEIYADLVNDDSLDRIDITKVGNAGPFATMWLSSNPHHWEWLSPLLYGSYEELRDDYPDATLQFDFWGDTDILPSKTVYIELSGVPGDPANPVDFIYPAFSQQVIPPDSTFEWDVDRNAGDMLTLGIYSEDEVGPDLYFECPVSMNTTSWKPGPLPVGSDLSLFVSVSNVKDWGNGKPEYPTMISGGDEFEYGLLLEYFNEMSFYVGPVDIVPDTITTNTKSITCHIWPLYGYDVTQIDPDSIYLNGEIRPTRTSVRTKQQMMIVKFPTVGLDLSVNPELLLSVEGMVGGTPFEGTDYVEVVQKGGKPN